MGVPASSISCLFLESHEQNGGSIVKTNFLKSLIVFRFCYGYSTNGSLQPSLVTVSCHLQMTNFAISSSFNPSHFSWLLISILLLGN